jgi:hypothetical protein
MSCRLYQVGCIGENKAETKQEELYLVPSTHTTIRGVSAPVPTARRRTLLLTILSDLSETSVLHSDIPKNGSTLKLII